MKSGSPSRTTAAHKTQTKIPGLVLSRLPLSSLLLLFLPKLLRGTRDRWVVQVSFIIYGDVNTAIHIIFFPLNYVVITRSFLVITRSFLVITRSFLVITRSFLVITRSFLVITTSFLVITRSFLVITRSFLVITTSFLVITTYFSRNNDMCRYNRYMVELRWGVSALLSLT